MSEMTAEKVSALLDRCSDSLFLDGRELDLRHHAKDIAAWGLAEHERAEQLSAERDELRSKITRTKQRAVEIVASLPGRSHIPPPEGEVWGSVGIWTAEDYAEALADRRARVANYRRNRAMRELIRRHRAEYLEILRGIPETRKKR